jgi:ActR/RegA family two-component response regulator
MLNNLAKEKTSNKGEHGSRTMERINQGVIAMLVNARTKVLIVEDYESWRRRYEKRLTQLGYKVIGADGLQGASDLISRHFFHAALIDMRLVDADASNEQGMVVLERLLQVGENTGTIVLTGYPPKREREAFVKYRVVDFLQKETLEEVQLFEALERAMEQSKKYLEEREKKDLEPRNLLSGFDLRGVEKRLMGGQSSDVLSILQNLLRPLVPLITSTKYTRIDTTWHYPIFETRYWSRYLGEAVNVRVGYRNQILEEVNQLRQTGKEIHLETQQSASGLWYIVRDVSPHEFVQA